MTTKLLPARHAAHRPADAVGDGRPAPPDDRRRLPRIWRGPADQPTWPARPCSACWLSPRWLYLWDLSASGYANSSPAHHYELKLPDEPGPFIVTGDADRLHQVFANLLANSRVHTPPGTRVVVMLSSSDPGTAVVTVLDDGPGIAEDILPTIFERFARGAPSRHRDTGSTGIGLAIVRAIVQSHHGTVQVISRPGQTAFNVRLPLGGALTHHEGAT